MHACTQSGFTDPNVTGSERTRDSPAIIPDVVAERHHEISNSTSYDGGQGPQEKGREQPTRLAEYLPE